MSDHPAYPPVKTNMQEIQKLVKEAKNIILEVSKGKIVAEHANPRIERIINEAHQNGKEAVSLISY